MVLMLPAGLALLAERMTAQQKPPSPDPLPPNLPVPKDDGGAKHLTGMAVPSIPLMSTSKRMVDISKPTRARTIVYFYPMTGRPGVTMPPGWDDIPGARGCTLETCGFRDLHAELAKLNAGVYGISVQSTDYHKEMVDRLKVPFDVLSDEKMALAKAMKLPLFTAGGMTLNKRLTLVLRGGKVEHVFYPVFPPDKHADEVIAWLKAHRT
jgi:peroxiredoxin